MPTAGYVVIRVYKNSIPPAVDPIDGGFFIFGLRRSREKKMTTTNLKRTHTPGITTAVSSIIGIIIAIIAIIRQRRRCLL